MLRDSYIIRQRGFKLTFIGGILAFINVIIGLVSHNKNNIKIIY